MLKNLSWERLETWEREGESVRESSCPVPWGGKKNEKWKEFELWKVETLNIIRLKT